MTIYDLPNGERLHQFCDGSFAVGHGPIRFITREEAEELYKESVEP